ncbi:hypothetical protein CWG93_18920 [Salmonella enterica subsp. enterica serovar Sandiego]|nr:hypothetical protein [Salmonella enterica subsp. enterica serovar Sandiego]
MKIKSIKKIFYTTLLLLMNLNFEKSFAYVLNKNPAVNISIDFIVDPYGGLQVKTDANSTFNMSSGEMQVSNPVGLANRSYLTPSHSGSNTTTGMYFYDNTRIIDLIGDKYNHRVQIPVDLEQVSAAHEGWGEFHYPSCKSSYSQADIPGFMRIETSIGKISNCRSTAVQIDGTKSNFQLGGVSLNWKFGGNKDIKDIINDDTIPADTYRWQGYLQGTCLTYGYGGMAGNQFIVAQWCSDFNAAVTITKQPFLNEVTISTNQIDIPAISGNHGNFTGLQQFMVNVNGAIGNRLKIEPHFKGAGLQGALKNVSNPADIIPYTLEVKSRTTGESFIIIDGSKNKAAPARFSPPANVGESLNSVYDFTVSFDVQKNINAPATYTDNITLLFDPDAA